MAAGWGVVRRPRPDRQPREVEHAIQFRVTTQDRRRRRRCPWAARLGRGGEAIPRLSLDLPEGAQSRRDGDLAGRVQEAEEDLDPRYRPRLREWLQARCGKRRGHRLRDGRRRPCLLLEPGGRAEGWVIGP